MRTTDLPLNLNLLYIHSIGTLEFLLAVTHHQLFELYKAKLTNTPRIYYVN